MTEDGNSDAVFVKPGQESAEEGDGEVVAKNRKSNTKTRASTMSEQGGDEGLRRRGAREDSRIPPRKRASVGSDEAPEVKPETTRYI